MPSNPARFVYGTITVGALLATESARRETYLETVGAVVLALVLFWLAHGYAEFTARRLQLTDELTLGAFAESMAHESPILLGSAAPLLAVLLSWAAGATLSTAVTVAIWTAAAMTLAIEVVAGLRSERSGLELVAQITIGLTLGLLVIGIKLVLH